MASIKGLSWSASAMLAYPLAVALAHHSEIVGLTLTNDGSTNSRMATIEPVELTATHKSNWMRLRGSPTSDPGRHSTTEAPAQGF
jgi:hypothetical protein